MNARPRMGRLACLALLAALATACSSAPTDDETIDSTSSALTSLGGLKADLLVYSQWNEGYCGEVVLTNTHATATVHQWKVTLDFHESRLQQGWSGNFAGSTGLVSVTPMSWNTTIVPSASTRFGFCATIPRPGIVATLASVTDDLPGGNCVERAVPPVPTRVQMRVADVDDFVYLTVNGLRSKVWHYGGPNQGELIDVTRWFVNGANSVRIQAINGGGPADYAVELWVDGSRVLNESCPDATCNPNMDTASGILFDRSLTVTLNGLPAAQRVNLTSSAPGKLYVNGQYTGLSTPASLTVPPGNYTFGLGQSNDTLGAYTGRFYERSLTVGVCPHELNLTAVAPLPQQNSTRVGILPVRRTVHGDPNDIGVLADSDVPYLVNQANASSDAWVEPFSYGLTGWSVTALPVVENAVMQRGPDCMDPPNTGLLLDEAGLGALRDQYDIIVYLYSSHRADGSDVAHVPCAIWAGGQDISYHSGWLRSVPPGQPSEGLYHESLHSFEWYNAWRHGYYGGVSGLHGAGQHGYVYNQGGEGDWLAWYRAFSRNQVAEVVGMRDDVAWPNIPTTADLYVGVFDAMRWGVQEPAAQNASSALAALRARNVAAPLNGDTE